MSIITRAVYMYFLETFPHDQWKTLVQFLCFILCRELNLADTAILTLRYLSK